MKKLYLVILISMTSLTSLFAQFKNTFAINYGEIYLTDWQARFRHDYGASFTHTWFNHFTTKLNTCFYYTDILGFLSSNGIPLDKRLVTKNYAEGNICLGYILMTKDSNLKINIGGGVSYRKRQESFMVAYGVTSGGWAEIFIDGYTRKEFGCVINTDINYKIWKNFTLGFYNQIKLYPNHVETIYPNIIHDSPNSDSYGFSLGFSF